MDRKHPHYWTDARMDRLKALCLAGYSAGHIAKDLTTPEKEFTRNMVIGMVRRNGLKLKGREVKGAPFPGGSAAVEKDKIRVQGVLKKPKSLDPGLRQEDPSTYDDRQVPGVQLLALTSKTCKWPIGDPRREGFRFCGAHHIPGEVYCTHHRLRATHEKVRHLVADRIRRAS